MIDQPSPLADLKSWEAYSQRLQKIPAGGLLVRNALRRARELIASKKDEGSASKTA